MLELLEEERYWLGLDGSTGAGAKPLPHNPSAGSIPACSQESLCTHKHKQDSDSWLCPQTVLILRLENCNDLIRDERDRFVGGTRLITYLCFEEAKNLKGWFTGN